MTRHPQLPSTREELYERLGLIDRGPDPTSSCRNCDACRGIEPSGSSAYKPAERAGAATLEADTVYRDRTWRLAHVIETASKSKLEKGVIQGRLLRIAAWEPHDEKAV